MTLAILCSGQGWQGPGMFALTGDAPRAAGLFFYAATLFGGRDPRLVVREESSQAVHGDRMGQILCTLQALAAVAALKDVLPQRFIAAGYSIGELAAWGVAGFLDAEEVLHLAATRAEAMDAASPSGDGLMFVRGLSRATVDRLCARYGVEVAIVEPGDAFVLGGARTALSSLADEARCADARIVDLPVEVASHTSRLRQASQAFRRVLAQCNVRGAAVGPVRVMSGVDAMPVTDLSSGLEKLSRQISEPVQWGACLQSCCEAGASAFLELGPGRALSRMVTDEFPGIPARAMDDFRTLDGVRTWLTQHAS